MNGLVKIGQTGKPHGVAGELNCTFTLDDDTLEKIFNGKKVFLFLYREGLPIPLEVENWRLKGSSIILLKFKSLESRESAEMWNGCDIAVESNHLPEGTHFTARHFIGFHLYDPENRFIGKVVSVDDATINLLFVIESPEGHRFMAPIADEFIDYIDAETQTMGISLPSGLELL